MQQLTQMPEKNKEDLSLKEILLTLQDWLRYLFSKWLIIGLVGLLGAGLGVVYSLFKKTSYTAELTFVLEESKGGSLGSYAGIASQFGIDIGGGGNEIGVFSGDNILAFLKSRLMVERTLLQPVKIPGGEMSLANLYIEGNELRKTWEKNERLRGINFPIGQDRSKFTVLQDSTLFAIYESITKGDLDVKKPDKKMSFISVKCVSRNELFAKTFVERLVTEATDFYVITKTKRAKANVDVLQAKADSLERLLNRKIYSAAVSKDVNLNPIKNVASVGTEVALRDKTMLQTVYAEVVKNLELSRLSMAQETPLIQLVDQPIFPLPKKKFGPVKGFVLGGIIAGILIIVILLVKRLLREIMGNG